MYFDEAVKGLEAQLKDLEKAQKFIFMEYHAIEDAEACLLYTSKRTKFYRKKMKLLLSSLVRDKDQSQEKRTMIWQN